MPSLPSGNACLNELVISSLITNPNGIAVSKLNDISSIFLLIIILPLLYDSSILNNKLSGGS
jgi:hypothetical protein